MDGWVSIDNCWVEWSSAGQRGSAAAQTALSDDSALSLIRRTQHGVSTTECRALDCGNKKMRESTVARELDGEERKEEPGGSVSGQWPVWQCWGREADHCRQTPPSIIGLRK